MLLCAPSNVAAANLHERCVADGWGDECALALAPDRVPPGTAVESDDPSRRLVCATVSARAGPALHRQAFDVVLVDEAAQLVEAWAWTLLRRDVAHLVLAGDVKQLPAVASESGRALRHERSLMERLVVDCGYANVVTLTEQNRMAPQLLAFPNGAFYDGALRTGPHAPAEGRVRWIVCADGREEEAGTSWANAAEARACAEAAAEGDDVVLISPYVAQCRLLLAQRTGRAVHTIDSFQGREADVVACSASCATARAAWASSTTRGA